MLINIYTHTCYRVTIHKTNSELNKVYIEVVNIFLSKTYFYLEKEKDCPATKYKYNNRSPSFW